MLRLFFSFCFLFSVMPLAAQEPLSLRFEQAIQINRGNNKLQICAHKAETLQDRTVGLMFQESLPEKGGMVFDFQETDIVHMWMRNTVLPLDMIFIDETGTIVKISEKATPFSLEIISSDVPARFVLEVNAGVAKKFSIKKGDEIIFKMKKCSLE